MPTNEQPVQTNRMKKMNHYTCYCCLYVVGSISIVVIPGVYVYFTLNNAPKGGTNKGDFSSKCRGRVEFPSLPWYTSKGMAYPKATDENNEPKIWPDEDKTDRIENQLMYVPRLGASLVKTIVMYHKNIPNAISLKVGQDSFFGCPVESCSVSVDISDIKTAKAVLFNDREHVKPSIKYIRPSHQVWILFFTKNPLHEKKLDHFSGSINWTASYRTDSDIVTPSHKWVYYNQSIRSECKLSRNFADGKSKKVVWFVKDTRTDNNRRKEYAKELQKYIEVDVFGDSDDHQCPCVSPSHCLQLLSQYKFFLAFENSDCRDYITEKFFISLQRAVVPLVMGPPPEDYKKTVPQNSYIHVDEFSSAKELAEYLVKLDKNDDLYNSYFSWRGTGELIDARVECRLCAMLHSDRVKNYADVNVWWSENGCTNDTRKKG